MLIRILLQCLLSTILTEADFITEDGKSVEVRFGYGAITSEQENQFRNDFDLAKDVDLTVQRIENTFRSDGRVYALDGEILNPFTESATYMHNGENGDLPISRVVQQKYANGTIITITKDDNGGNASIMIVNRDGSSQEFVGIAPGFLVSITPDDYDLDELQGKLSYAEPEPTLTFVNTSFHTNDKYEECILYKQIELAVVYDTSFCDAYGGTQNKADQEVMSLIGMVSSRYQAQGFCVKIELSHLEGYCDPISDPYLDMIALKKCESDIDDDIGLLPSFIEYWNANRTAVHRDIAHLFTGSSMDCNETCVLGCATLATTCIKERAYSIIQVPISNSLMIRSTVISHQLGQNNGVKRYHYNVNENIMNEKIVPADKGFSKAAIDAMNMYISSVSCITTFSLNDASTASPTEVSDTKENVVFPILSCGLLFLVCVYPYQSWHNSREARGKLRSPTDCDESFSDSSVETASERTCNTIFC